MWVVIRIHLLDPTAQDPVVFGSWPTRAAAAAWVGARIVGRVTYSYQVRQVLAF